MISLVCGLTHNLGILGVVVFPDAMLMGWASSKSFLTHWFFNCYCADGGNWSASRIDARHTMEHFVYVLLQIGTIMQGHLEGLYFPTG